MEPEELFEDRSIRDRDHAIAIISPCPSSPVAAHCVGDLGFRQGAELGPGVFDRAELGAQLELRISLGRQRLAQREIASLVEFRLQRRRPWVTRHGEKAVVNEKAAFCLTHKLHMGEVDDPRRVHWYDGATRHLDQVIDGLKEGNAHNDILTSKQPTLSRRLPDGSIRRSDLPVDGHSYLACPRPILLGNQPCRGCLMPILSVPFSYEATVRYKRKRSTSTHCFRAEIPVEIAEVAAQDAPVAIRIKDKWARPVEQTYRWRDAKLWAQELLREKPVSLTAFIESLAGTDHELNPSSRFSDRQLERDLDIQEVYQTDREETERKVRRAASDVMFVDGFQWKVVEEPFLAADMERDYPSVRLIEGYERRPPFQSFRLDELGLIKEIYGERVERAKAFREPEQIEILIPESIKRRFEPDLLLATAREVGRVMSNRIELLDVAYFSAFAALRDETWALEQMLRTDPAADLTELSQKLREALQQTAADREKHELGGAWFEEDKLRALARVDRYVGEIELGTLELKL